MKYLNGFFNILIFSLVAVYVGYYSFLKSSSSVLEEVQQTDLSSHDVDKVVNKYMKQTNEKMLLDKYNVNQALNKALKEPVSYVKPQIIRPEDVPIEQQIGKDQPLDTPAEEINEKLQEKAALDQQDAIDKKEYNRQFIENARKGGFEIILSEDGSKVINVKPIRKPSQRYDSVETIPSN